MTTNVVIALDEKVFKPYIQGIKQQLDRRSVIHDLLQKHPDAVKVPRRAEDPEPDWGKS